MQVSRKLFFILLILIALTPNWMYAQNITAGFPVLEEVQRRNQLLGDTTNTYSFSFRTSSINPSILFFGKPQKPGKKPLGEFSLLPVLATMRYNTDRPYGWGDYGMIPNKGMQTYISTIWIRLVVSIGRFQPSHDDLPFKRPQKSFCWFSCIQGQMSKSRCVVGEN